MNGAKIRQRSGFRLGAMGSSFVALGYEIKEKRRNARDAHPFKALPPAGRALVAPWLSVFLSLGGELRVYNPIHEKTICYEARMAGRVAHVRVSWLALINETESGMSAAHALRELVRGVLLPPRDVFSKAMAEASLCMDAVMAQAGSDSRVEFAESLHDTREALAAAFMLVTAEEVSDMVASTKLNLGQPPVVKMGPAPDWLMASAWQGEGL